MNSQHNRRRFRIELIPLTALALAAAGAWTFVEIADEVKEGETAALDERLLLAMRSPVDPHEPLGPEWTEEMARDITALGGVIVLALLTAAVAGFLVLQGKPAAALLVCLAIGTGAGMGSMLKKSFARQRPDLVSHETQVYTSSFPSGHSMLSAVTYLTLGALLARVYRSYRVKAYLLSVAVTLTILIGVSRVYLGVHWPTDVLAGWAAGSAWAMLWWLVAWFMQRRGQVESESNGPE